MSIIDKVKSIVSLQLGVEPEKIQDDLSLIDDLGADSLDSVEIIMALEDEFNIVIKTENLEVDTVAEIASLVEECQKHQTQQGG